MSGSTGRSRTTITWDTRPAPQPHVHSGSGVVAGVGYRRKYRHFHAAGPVVVAATAGAAARAVGDDLVHRPAHGKQSRAARGVLPDVSGFPETGEGIFPG